MDKKRTNLEKPFTDVELELMAVIWELKECTVKEVQAALPEDRKLAYTSVATMMKILEKKGALESQKRDRAHTYTPLVTRSEYEALSLKHLQSQVFGGDPASMVMRLLNDSDLSDDEMKAIKALLDERSRS